MLKQIFFFLIAVVCCVACKPREEKQAAFPEVNDQPVLTMVKTDGTEVFLRGLTGKLILIFFNPDCDHCQNEAKAIAESKKLFEDYQLYFISSDSVHNVVRFANDYQLIEPNMHLGTATPPDVYRAMGPIDAVPAIYIYNDRKKVKEFKGEVKLEELRKYL